MSRRLCVCVHRGGTFLGVSERTKCCPFCKYSENSAVGETVPGVAAPSGKVFGAEPRGPHIPGFLGGGQERFGRY